VLYHLSHTLSPYIVLLNSLNSIKESSLVWNCFFILQIIWPLPPPKVQNLTFLTLCIERSICKLPTYLVLLPWVSHFSLLSIDLNHLVSLCLASGKHHLSKRNTILILTSGCDKFLRKSMDAFKYRRMHRSAIN
jgi:hypothetical protein